MSTLQKDLHHTFPYAVWHPSCSSKCSATPHAHFLINTPEAESVLRTYSKLRESGHEEIWVQFLRSTTVLTIYFSSSIFQNLYEPSCAKAHDSIPLVYSMYCVVDHASANDTEKSSIEQNFSFCATRQTKTFADADALVTTPLTYSCTFPDYFNCTFINSCHRNYIRPSQVVADCIRHCSVVSGRPYMHQQ